MITKIIEATNGFNWGKFAVCRFTLDQWCKVSPISHAPLLSGLGWDPRFIWVLDLQTGEGAFFRPGGLASADLNKHKIWVCPLYEPFLEWLYKQDLVELEFLPDVVELPNAESSFHGYRRPGP